MAERFWPGGNPVGSRIVHQQVAREVVGVAGGVRHFGLDRAAPFEMYTPHAQQPSYHTMTLAIRAGIDPPALVPLVRRELAAMDPDVPISAVATMDDVVAHSTTAPRFRTVLLGAFAALAVVLSVVGVGGVVAYVVGRRTHEIGVRVALGATSGQVMAMILRQGMAPAAIGAAIGLAGALAFTRVLASLLFAVTPTDPLTFTGASALIVVVAFAGSWLPARRAMRVDPIAALRIE
jgi:putative ABC transport system permease protein